MKIQPTFYIALIIFMASGALVLLMVYPLLKDINNSTIEILSDQDRVILVESETRELDNFKSKRKDYEPNFSKADALFVDLQNPVNFIRFLEDTASSLNIKLDINLPTLPKERTGNMPLALFQVSAKGSFLNILEFSKKLETGPYLMGIRKLAISKLTEKTADGESPSHNVNADFLLEIMGK